MTRRCSRRSGRGRQTLAALAAALLVLVGCGGGADAGGTSGPFRIASSFEIGSLDPLAEGFWSPGFGYGELLLRPTPDGVPEPWILESAEATSPTQWNLTLHEGVTFQNGNPLDGKALAAMLNYQIAKHPVVQPILPGARAKATGPTTATLTTTSPVSFVPNLLASEEAFPVYDVAAYKAAKGDEQALLEAGIYTGPYVVTELNAEHLLAERDDDYWQGTPALPGVEVKFIEDPQARVLAVQSGEVDMDIYPPTEAAATVEGSGTAHYLTADEGTLGPRVIFNLDKSPIDDVQVRRALIAAIDYETIADDVMDGYYDVAGGMYPMHLPFAVENQVYDPERAEDLLEQAGWVESGEGRAKDGEPLEVIIASFRDDPDLQPIAVAMRSQLEEVGFEIEIKELEDFTAISDENFDDWHLALRRTGYFGNTGSIVEIVHDYLTSDGARNEAGIANPEIDALAEQMDRALDEQQQYALLRELQDVVITENAYTMAPAAKRRAVVVSDAWADYEVSPHYIFVDWQTAP